MGRRAREPDSPPAAAPEPGSAALVAALHADLADWMGTDAPPKVFDRFAAALHEKFTAVTILAEVVDREALLTGVWSVRNAQPGLRIEITDFEELADAGPVLAVRFVAEYRHGDMLARRRVSAVLSASDHGYQWRSLHETAFPADRQPPAG
ncbi:hypothetical protein [Nocardia sp. NPDC048505]|uniref:hypothetical protein n=1 Tax=unclassified Nocardia TaxID=2637762 RepID=UPI00340D4BF6